MLSVQPFLAPALLFSFAFQHLQAHGDAQPLVSLFLFAPAHALSVQPFLAPALLFLFAFLYLLALCDVLPLAFSSLFAPAHVLSVQLFLATAPLFLARVVGLACPWQNQLELVGPQLI